MSDFDSTLVVETDAEKDLRLPHTRQMILVGAVSAVQCSPFPKYLYVRDRSLTVYQLAPFRQIRALEYEGDVMDMAIVKGRMVILSRDSIVTTGRDGDLVVTGDFDGRLSAIEENLGVQERGKLSVYSLETLSVLDVYEASAHYSIRDVLITSLDNIVSLYRKGRKVLEISMPERIGRLCADPLLTSMYCGADDGTIFCCGMSYSEPMAMRYHKSRIVGLDMSFCGRYLYSADAEGVICIWDTKLNVVIGKASMESEIRGMKVVYVSEWRREPGAVDNELVMLHRTVQ